MRRTVFRFATEGTWVGTSNPASLAGTHPAPPPMFVAVERFGHLLILCNRFQLIVTTFDSHSYSRWTSNFVVVSFGTCRVLVWSVCGPCSRARFCCVRARLWLRCRARRVRICSGTIRIGRAESSVSKCSSMPCAVCSGRALLPLCCPCCAAAARAR